jgi:hypothetical protein
MKMAQNDGLSRLGTKARFRRRTFHVPKLLCLLGWTKLEQARPEQY